MSYFFFLIFSYLLTSLLGYYSSGTSNFIYYKTINVSDSELVVDRATYYELDQKILAILSSWFYELLRVNWIKLAASGIYKLILYLKALRLVFKFNNC